MKYGGCEIDWGYLGALLANQGDVEQAIFLKAFIKECQSWGTRWQVEQQLAYVNHKLSKEERDVLSMLSYDEKEDTK